MSNLIRSPVLGSPLALAPSQAVPHREQAQEAAGGRLPEPRTTGGSQPAGFAATAKAGKFGYGALVFWVIIAVLVAARIALVEPGKIETTSSPSGTNPASSVHTGGSLSPKN